MVPASARVGARATRAASQGRRPAVRAVAATTTRAKMASRAALRSTYRRTCAAWSPAPRAGWAVSHISAPVSTGYSTYGTSPGTRSR